MTDPFTLIHDALFGIVRDSKAVQLAVTNYKKNLVGGNESRLPRLDTVRASDLPEIYMTTTGLEGQVSFSSATVDFMRSFEFRITTGDQRPNKFLYPVEFSMLCALTEANFGQVLRQLEWYGQKYVTDVELVGIEEGMESEDNRGVKGYSALFSIDARLSLGRQSLIKFNAGDIMP